jgi:radical SAM-linked protein
MSEARQRWRLVFSRGEDARYLSHLDAIKLWERAFRRGEIPVAMTEGFSPRPRLAFAAPLQLGMLAEHELADLFLSDRLTAPDLRDRLAACMPAGYEILDMHDVWVGAAAIATQLAAADYRLSLIGAPPEELAEAAARLMEAESLPRERRREAKPIPYDLRPLLLSLSIRPAEGSWTAADAGPAAEGELPRAVLRTRVVHTQDRGTGRVTEVVAALAEEAGLRYSPGPDSDETERASAEEARDLYASGGVPAGEAVRTIEVVHPVRERLWVAAELAGLLEA